MQIAHCLFLEFVLLQRLLVGIRVIALEVHEEVAALGDFAEQTAAGGVVFLVILQVVGQLRDLTREERNLDLGGTRVFLVRLVLSDDRLLDASLQSHKNMSKGSTGRAANGIYPGGSSDTRTYCKDYPF